MNTANKNGILFGLLCPGELRAKKEPVAYLYNGVRLPKLPEWDREMYPYAVIFLNAGYRILAFSADMHVRKGEYVAEVVAASSYQFWRLRNDLWEWSDYAVPNGAALEVIKWADFDVYTLDGTLYLAASDPIPVYE